MFNLRIRNAQSNNAHRTDPLDVSHLVDLRNVVKEYDTPAGKFRALDGIDLKVDKR